MSSKTISTLALACLGVAVAALLVPLPSQNRAVWIAKLLDLGHVPVFALVTLCFWYVVGRSIWLATVLALALAVAAEAGQASTGRSTEFLDVVRGLLGVLIAVSWLKYPTHSIRWRPVVARLALSCALVAWPIWDCGPALFDAISAYRSFPVLCDFESPWELLRWYRDGGRLDRVASDEPGESWVGRLDVRPGEGGTGVILFPIVQDWSGHKQLLFTFSFSGEPMCVLISVRDGRKVRPPHRRFDLERQYSAGRHRIVIDLEDLARGTQFAPLDLTRIQSFHVVVTQLTEARTLYLHKIELK